MERVQQAWSSWGRWWARYAHLTRADARRHGFTRLSPLSSLVLLLTLLAASAGCGMSMMSAGILVGFHSSSIFLLFFFVAAIVCILLAAGVEIKIPKRIHVQPPSGWAGRFFLAILGVSMSLLSIWLWGYMYAPRQLDLGGLVELPSVEGRRFVLTRELSGEVSFGENEKFGESYSTLIIRAVAEDAFDVEADIDRDGRFAMDIPVDTQLPVTVTWRARKPGDYVLWPMEIIVPASQGEDPTDISFSFRRVDDVFVQQKNDAIDAVRACEFERADAVLPALLAILKPFEDTGLRAQEWPYDIHVELANEAAELRGCTQDAWVFERKWRREAIERATTRERRIYAMNAWAGYSREVYRPGGRAWPDLTLSDVGLAREEYRNFLREDLQLVRTQLPGRRALVSNAMAPPAIAGCLNDGQRTALDLFESTLATELEEVKLNRMMNAISGLQRILLLGTWIDYPAPGMGEIEIARERGGDGYLYRFKPRNSNTEPGPRELTFAPDVSAPCRFETTVDIPGRRFVYVILEGHRKDGYLRMEPGGQIFRPAE